MLQICQWIQDSGKIQQFDVFTSLTCKETCTFRKTAVVQNPMPFLINESSLCANKILVYGQYMQDFDVFFDVEFEYHMKNCVSIMSSNISNKNCENSHEFLRFF